MKPYLLIAKAAATTDTMVMGWSSFDAFTGTEYTVANVPLPPIGRFPEDSFIWEDKRGLLHYGRPEAKA